MKVIKYSIALFFILVCATSPIRAQVLPKLSTYDYMMGNGANTWYTKINAAIDSLNSLIDSLAVHRAMIYVAAGGTVDSLQFLGTNRDNQSVYGATRFLDSVYVALVLRFGYWPGVNNGYIKGGASSSMYYDHGWGGSHYFTGYLGGNSILTMNNVSAIFYVPLNIDSLITRTLRKDTARTIHLDSCMYRYKEFETPEYMWTAAATEAREGAVELEVYGQASGPVTTFFIQYDSTNNVTHNAIEAKTYSGNAVYTQGTVSSFNSTAIHLAGFAGTSRMTTYFTYVSATTIRCSVYAIEGGTGQRYRLMVRITYAIPVGSTSALPVVLKSDNL